MGFQDFIDQYVFPPSQSDYYDPREMQPAPPTYGQRGPIPTFEGSTHTIHPISGQVNETPVEDDPHPDAEPEPVMDKKTAKAIAPYHNRLMDLVEGFGTKHMLVPGTRDLYEALGVSAKQLGIRPTAGHPFGKIIEAFSPDHQNAKAMQEGVDKIYSTLLAAKLGETMTGPGTVGEAEHLFGKGAIPLTPGQAANQIEAPRGSLPADQGGLAPNQYGPQPGVVNPETPLTLPQQMGPIKALMHGLGTGALVKDPDTGQLITSWQASARENPQFLEPESAQAAIEKLPYTPKGFIIPKDAKGRVPNAVFDSLITKFSPPVSQLNPTLGVDRESVARRVTSQVLGRPLSYNQMLAEAPHLAPQIDKELQDYIRTTTSNKVDATSDTRRAQPVGGLVSNYARLNKYGEIEKPSDPKLSEDQLNNQGYVNVMHLKPEVEAYNSLNVIQQDMNKLRSYADELFKAGPGAFSLAKQGLGVKVNKLTEKGKLTNIRGSNGKLLTRGQLATIYEREVNSMLEYYGRNLRGLRGAATEGDVNRMRDSFANEFNSEETKNKLFEDLQTFIGNVQQAGRRTIFGAPNSQRMPVAERYEQLKKEGKLTEEQIYDQLHKEGYREGS